MRNARRHFRLDVYIPLVIKLAEEENVLSIVLPELSGGEWYGHEFVFDKTLKGLIEQVKSENETAGQVLRDLQGRVTMLAEAIICLAQGVEPKYRVEHYANRRKLSALVTHLKPGTYTVDLLRAFNEKIDFYLTAVDLAAAKNYSAFLDMMRAVEFSFDDYLETLTEKTNNERSLPHAVFALHAKLKRHLAIFNRFHQEIQYIEDHSSWPIRKVNLSAGGMGVLSSHPYPKFARLVIHFRLGAKNEVFILKGDLISGRKTADNQYYLAIQFTDATEVIENRLITLLQNEEIEQVMSYLEETAILKAAQARFVSDAT